MMLVEQSSVPASALPIAEFKDYLKLGKGFADDAVQDELLEMNLRAALSAVEERTGKAILERVFLWSISAWRDLSFQVLPVAPVSSIDQFQITDLSGSAEIIDPARYRLQQDRHRPVVSSTGVLLPSIPVGGMAQFTLTAGFGADWASVPADMAQAVFGIATFFYENRASAGQSKSSIPESLLALLQPYRNLRIGR